MALQRLVGVVLVEPFPVEEAVFPHVSAVPDDTADLRELAIAVGAVVRVLAVVDDGIPVEVSEQPDHPALERRELTVQRLHSLSFLVLSGTWRRDVPSLQVTLGQTGGLQHAGHVGAVVGVAHELEAVPVPVQLRSGEEQPLGALGAGHPARQVGDDVDPLPGVLRDPDLPRLDRGEPHHSLRLVDLELGHIVAPFSVCDDTDAALTGERRDGSTYLETRSQ